VPPSPTDVPPACYLCGGKDLRLRFAAARQDEAPDSTAYNCTSFGHRRHPPIWVCRECGLMFQWPRKSEAQLLASYADVEDPLYILEKDNRYLTFGRVLKELGPPQGRSLLDVGAHCGFFLDVARQAGFRAEGLEVSRWAAAQARGLGLTIYGETLAQRAKQGRYDLVTLWDVIEHFADPRADLEAVHRMLPVGGRVFISTIDSGSVVARTLGSSWPWLMDMHLFYFNRTTLAVLLESAGFRVLGRQNYTHVVSARYLMQKAAASFPSFAAFARLGQRVLPSRWAIPVNLGDNMLMVAERL
jgi:2-polyprenyl-3-methyl-5-hydroxy-6-metoxy-1,4-benzoquinol methylase